METVASGRKPAEEQLRPTPVPERARERILWCCRPLDTRALQQRITAWQRRHGWVTRSQQAAALQAIGADLPAYAASHSPVLHDVLARLDKTSQAFLRRVKNGAQAGFPRCHGKERSHSFPYQADGNGARLATG